MEWGPRRVAPTGLGTAGDTSGRGDACSAASCGSPAPVRPPVRHPRPAARSCLRPPRTAGGGRTARRPAPHLHLRQWREAERQASTAIKLHGSKASRHRGASCRPRPAWPHLQGPPRRERCSGRAPRARAARPARPPTRPPPAPQPPACTAEQGSRAGGACVPSARASAASSLPRVSHGCARRRGGGTHPAASSCPAAPKRRGVRAWKSAMWLEGLVSRYTSLQAEGQQCRRQAEGQQCRSVEWR